MFRLAVRPVLAALLLAATFIPSRPAASAAPALAAGAAQPIALDVPEIPLCAAGELPAIRYFNGMESSPTGFSTGANPGINHWSMTNTFVHSGLKAAYGNDNGPTTPRGTGSWLAMNRAITLPPGAILHFWHAHQFSEQGGIYEDGGIVEYTTDDGVRWTNVGINPVLTMTNGYQGNILATIFAGDVNPLRLQPAFVGDSQGYYSTAVDLSALAGQSVRFRWHLGLDSYPSSVGWFVDDVRIYRCSSVLPTLTNALYFPVVQR